MTRPPVPDPTSAATRRPAFAAGLALILALALVVRLPLLGHAAGSYRLTEAFSIEEVENVRISTGMLHKGSLHPHAFEYPSLFYELSLAVEAPLRALGRDTWTADLIGVRALSLLFGLAAVALVGLLGARLGGAWAGLTAAAIAALDRTLIDASATAKPNAAQVLFVLAGFLALCALAERATWRRAAAAAALFALAAASKWLGALGLAGLVAAPVLAAPAGDRTGIARLAAAGRAAWTARLPVWQVLLPLGVFAAVFVACVPGVLLSPREFGFGFAQTFIAQSLHRRPFPAWIPLLWAWRSLGPVGALAALGGVAWALARLARWDGAARTSGIVLVLGWTLAYGALVTLVFVRLPSYLDLWIPFLAVLAGCALAGDDAPLGRRWRPAAATLALVGGLAANGAHGLAHAATEPVDTRVAAGEWLSAHADPADSVLADLGCFVPDRLPHVSWNWWGSPPRVIYDETATWGRDPAWPEWYGGHRRLVFENAKWAHPMELLARHPRWVVTTDQWAGIRAAPTGASETRAPEFDRSLADGSAGYVPRARFAPAVAPANPWRVRAIARGTDPPLLSGPVITVYERSDSAPRPAPAPVSSGVR